MVTINSVNYDSQFSMCNDYNINFEEYIRYKKIIIIFLN